MKTLKIAVLVSGNGSNLQVLIEHMQLGKLPIKIVAVISNKADAYALVRAKNANIATFVIDKNEQGKTSCIKAVGCGFGGTGRVYENLNATIY